MFLSFPTGFLLLNWDSTSLSSVCPMRTSPPSRPRSRNSGLNSISKCSRTRFPNSSNGICSLFCCAALLPLRISLFILRCKHVLSPHSACKLRILLIFVYSVGPGMILLKLYCSIKCWINTCDTTKNSEKIEIHLGKQSVDTDTNYKGALPYLSL